MEAQCLEVLQGRALGDLLEVKMEDGRAHADAGGELGHGDRPGWSVMQEAYGSGNLREVTVKAKAGADAGATGARQRAIEQLAHNGWTKHLGVLRLRCGLEQTQERASDLSGELLRLKDGELFAAGLAEIEVHGAEQLQYDLGAELHEDG